MYIYINVLEKKILNKRNTHFFTYGIIFYPSATTIQRRWFLDLSKTGEPPTKVSSLALIGYIHIHIYIIMY